MSIPCFPTLFSTPDPDALGQLVAREYRLPSPAPLSSVRCELFRAGRNDHYRLYLGDDVYHLKVYAFSEYWQEKHAARLHTEVAWLNHLHACDIPVGAPLSRRDGACLTPLNAPEGTRYALLMRYVPGELFGQREQPLSRFRDLGVLVARMHACLDELPDDFTSVNWDLHWLVDVPLTQLEPALAHRRADFRALQQIGEAIKSKIRSLLPQHRPEYGLIHGDLHQDNVHDDPRSSFGFVDAESFGYGWRVWEIVYLVFGHLHAWSPQDEIDYERRWETFVTGYGQVRALSAAEVEAAPVFVLARYLLALGRIVRLNARFDGGGALDDGRIVAWIDFMHQWIAHYDPL